ncbi:MAG: MG2 domain-containing protein, partial [Bacteroidota bacterium]
MENKDSLQRTRVEFYAEILNERKKGRIFRPTLYDLLANRAIDVFRNTEFGLTQPAFRFNLDDPAVFGSDERFASATFESPDTMSFQLHAIRIFQSLTRQHMNDENPDARVMLALNRLKFTKSKSILDDKDQRFIDAVTKLEQRYAKHPVSIWATIERAGFHVNRASQYDFNNGDEHKNEYKTAFKICEEGIARFPKYKATKNLRALRANILNKNIGMTVEEINTPDQPFRASINYRNVEKVWLKIVPVDETTRRWMDRKGARDVLDKLKTLSRSHAWDLELPKDLDYNPHTTEIAIPALKAGFYAIIMSDNADFGVDKEATAYTLTHVSALGFVSRRTAKEEREFIVFDRETGKPLQGVKAQMLSRKYDYNTREYNYRPGASFTTDGNGMFSVKPGSDYRNYMMEFTYNGKKIRLGDQYYQYRYRPGTPKRQKQIQFFLDRGIYRPGQTIYFKGIVLEKYKDETKILPNFSTTVKLMDVNYQKVSEVKVTTNEFGTFSGTFTAPQGQ